MKKIFLIVIIFISFTFSLSAQTDTLECDAPGTDTTDAKLLPWYGNNDYLEAFLDSIGYDDVPRIVGVDKVKYHIPIKFWVYRTTAGAGGPGLPDLQAYIDRLNNFYNVVNDTRIGFYMKCDVGYINDDDHLLVSGSEANSLIASHKEAGCINVHITDALKDGSSGVHVRARFFGLDGIFLDDITYTDNRFAGTLSHEVGHYFELDHTHHHSESNNVCWVEAIDRNRTWGFFSACKLFGNKKNCETTGDLLRDTPADPDLNDNLGSNCTYTLDTEDMWGDNYLTPPSGSSQPNTRNLLSYNRDRSCRNAFTRLQIAVMLYSLERGKSSNNLAAWKSFDAIYDDYEPDNFSAMTEQAYRVITVGEIQERTFHKQYIETGAVWSQCDVDWVRFVAPCTTTFAIYTASMGYGLTNANTRLTLYDDDATTQLAQNDNIGGGSSFSRIQYAFTQGHTYYIRVDNMGSMAHSYYTLQINGAGISGLSTICGDATLSIPNLPSGAIITWSASPGGLVSFSPAGPTTATSTTVTNIGNGTATITATINVCGTTTITSTKAVIVGFPYFSNPISGGSVCWPNGNYTFSQPLPFGFPTPDDFQWTVPSGWTILSGQGTNTLYCNTGTTGGYIEVDVTACGVTRQNSKYVEIGESDWWPDLWGGGGDEEMRAEPTKLSVSASPNPATDNVIITINEAKPAITKGGANESKRGIKGIIIANKTGAIKRKLSFSGTQSSERISISGLEPDVYIVQVNTGTEVLSCKLVVIK